ncbi:MAG: DotU family type IV/VI secretion system protein [Planctomyces sp.]|nr:DotU family type IV/VI secretion system protein [Planctomyces sp.]
MTPRFSKAVDPIFMHVIRTLDRIERHEELNPHLEQAAIQSRIERAESELGGSPEWQLAKYALVAWIDDAMIFAEWSGNRWWQENPLEVVIYRERVAAYKFFQDAKEAAAAQLKDALEVFYVCVMLGFYGAYRPEAFGARDQDEHRLFLRQYDLPPTREAWAKQTRTYLRLQQGRPKISVNPREGNFAPPLEDKFAAISGWLLASVLLAAVFFLGWYLFPPTGS